MPYSMGTEITVFWTLLNIVPCISLFFFLQQSPFIFLLLYIFLILSIYFWPHWVFISVLRLYIVAVGSGSSLLWRSSFSQRLLLLWSMDSRCLRFCSYGTRPSCSKASGTFLDQKSNLCPLYWQADSYLLCNREVHINSVLCFVVLATRQVRSQLPAQELTPCPCTGRRCYNHWANREVPPVSSSGYSFLSFKVFHNKLVI